jgi:hypothetical protein
MLAEREAFATIDEEPDENELEAAQGANFSDFISHLPDGLEGRDSAASSGKKTSKPARPAGR